MKSDPETPIHTRRMLAAIEAAVAALVLCLSAFAAHELAAVLPSNGRGAAALASVMVTLLGILGFAWWRLQRRMGGPVAKLAEETARRQSADVLRLAGMAEIAARVLDDVGNVLGGIHVSASLARSRLRQSKACELSRIAEFLESHKENLADFLTRDPAGRQLPELLRLLATHLGDERADVLEELDVLSQTVGHVQTIVSTQQSYARRSSELEIVDVGAALDDAMQLNAASFIRQRIAVVRQYEVLPKVRLDRNKLLDILIHLISDAREALADTQSRGDRRLTLRTTVRGGRVQIHLCGGRMQRAWRGSGGRAHLGPATSPGKQTPGLHRCAVAASEVGGSLTAYGDDRGDGRTLVLELPCEPRS